MWESTPHSWRYNLRSFLTPSPLFRYTKNLPPGVVEMNLRPQAQPEGIQVRGEGEWGGGGDDRD